MTKVAIASVRSKHFSAWKLSILSHSHWLLQTRLDMSGFYGLFSRDRMINFFTVDVVKC